MAGHRHNGKTCAAYETALCSMALGRYTTGNRPADAAEPALQLNREDGICRKASRVRGFLIVFIKMGVQEEGV
ncbi:MAG: hypothetical protein ACLUO4_08855 [Christensenellales bacterium]